ncbi:MAG: class flavin-dependent oxidoreductase [Blastococcus sp.]|jgi:alkanesulfonate monooxygenase SsuD/methylene tetrahydromethanopterin reductase-like flavin-dependent oxidoreductase (luciferase family)|nr:class flavin-dependent oxidoreductase [Blastococcus sp.]
MESGSGPEFYFAHFMPYTGIPEDHKKYDSLWVDFPNSLYDPQLGHELYQRYLSELVLADKLGFDGLMVNEHHSTAYGMMPQPGIIAAALIPQTSNARICVMGRLLNFSYPNQLAEELAMLDVLSGGRLEVAFPLGTGMEYYSNNSAVNPATARERFEEGLDVLLRAWTEDGPFSYDGDFYNYRFLNAWPRPMQQPHPKIWFAGAGSPQTMDLVMKYGAGYSCVFIPKEQQDRAYALLRNKAEEQGAPPVSPDRLMFSVFCYVAETDELAEEEGKEHILWYFNNALRASAHYRMPPGYVPPAGLRKMLESSGLKFGTNDSKEMTWDDVKSWRAIAGSPETVANQLGEWLDETGAGRVLCHLHLGDMPHWKTEKNLTLFAEEVIPRLRGRVATTENEAVAR